MGRLGWFVGRWMGWVGELGWWAGRFNWRVGLGDLVGTPLTCHLAVLATALKP